MGNNHPFDHVTINEMPLLTVSDISKRLNLSRSFSYALMQSGAIRTVRIGRSRRVRPEDLEDFIKLNIYSANDINK